MGKVLLDSKYYTVKDGTIQRRNINPRAARFETGIPGYASFTRGSVEAYGSLRGGIGHKHQKSSGTEECYWSEGMDGSHEMGLVLGPKVNTAGTFGAAPVKIFDFENKTYTVGASKISEWSGTDWTPRETGIASPLDAIVVTDSTDTYAVVSDATSAKYTTDGTTWGALTGCKGYLTLHDNKLYGFYGTTLNYSPAKNIDGTWDSCELMEDYGTVNGLFTARSQRTDEPLLCLHSTNALWTIDPWVNEVYPYLKLTGHSSCGKAGLFWNSYIFVSTLGGIKKIAGTLVTDIGPDQNDGLPAGYQGYVSDMCVAGDGSWMVFSVNGGSANKSSIFKIHGTTGGIQQIYTTSAINTAINCVHYTPSHLQTNGRLWWGEGTNVKYCMFPDYNADVTEIGSYDFVAASGKCVYPILRDLEAINKTAIRVRGATKGCDSNKKFTIYYRTNANTATAVGSNWTELGTFIESPTPTALDFGLADGIEFKEIQFAVKAETNSSTSSPILRSLEFDYDVGTKRLRGWTFPVSVTRNDQADIVGNLHTSQDKDTMLLFYPNGDSTHGTSYRVKIANIAENITWDMFKRHGTVMVSVEELIRG